MKKTVIALVSAFLLVNGSVTFAGMISINNSFCNISGTCPAGWVVDDTGFPNTDCSVILLDCIGSCEWCRGATGVGNFCQFKMCSVCSADTGSGTTACGVKEIRPCTSFPGCTTCSATGSVSGTCSFKYCDL